MKETVAKESYVERWHREQKEKMGIPAAKGNPDDKNILGENAESGVTEGKQKEGRKHGTNTRSEGHEAPAE